MNQEASMACKFNCHLEKWKTSQGHGQSQCKMESLLLQATSRTWHVAHQIRI